MRIRTISFFLALALSVLPVCGHALAQEGPDFAKAASSKMGEGMWFWGLLNAPELLPGTTAVAVDAQTPSVLYAGGVGYIAVSRDSGANWDDSLKFSAGLKGNTGGGDSEDAAEKRAEALRDYIRTELEQQFDTEDIDALLDEVTDEELLEAEDLTDIDEFRGMEFEIETDLRNVGVNTSVASGVVLSEFSSYPERYLSLLRSGATELAAAEAAADSDGVWRFVTSPQAVYAVTSDVLYMTQDQGKHWDKFYEAESGSYILSYAVSGETLAIGLTNGLLLSRDGGEDWFSLGLDAVGGAIYEIHIGSAGQIWLLGTAGIYHSADSGQTWNVVDVPLEESEILMGIYPGEQGQMLALSNETLYYTSDMDIWNTVGTGPFADEIIRQVIPKNGSLSSFIVRTDSHLYEYNNGWVSQSKSLMASELGNAVLGGDDVVLAIMASPSGVWMAQDKSLFESSGEYRTLMDMWSREPSDEEVIARALEAHYLDDFADKSWGLRSRLSWLAPSVVFEYSFRQLVTDNHTVVYAHPYPNNQSDVKSDSYAMTRDKQTYWQIMAFWNIQIGMGLTDELSGKALNIRLRQKRERIIKLVQKELRSRRALQMTIVIDLPRVTKAKTAEKKLIKAQLGVQEIEARLHYLTGGYYIPAVHQGDSH
ncbi:MAG: hypothetical protein IJM59_06605 [Proteobacteria bacterium]|nr:hypothetical protein [Pseudomonadota bacterium]